MFLQRVNGKRTQVKTFKTHVKTKKKGVHFKNYQHIKIDKYNFGDLRGLESLEI